MLSRANRYLPLVFAIPTTATPCWDCTPKRSVPTGASSWMLSTSFCSPLSLWRGRRERLFPSPSARWVSTTIGAAQVKWAIELQLPLMIHCRKAQNEMVAILKRYARELPGGVFHCFTGNEQEARQLLDFDRFVLGIGGVLTFKKSHLPEVLPACVPLDRIVLETDAPYMAPVPMRGKRNESAFIRHVISRLAEAYGVTEEEICRQTTATAERIFRV